MNDKQIKDLRDALEPFWLFPPPRYPLSPKSKGDGKHG